MGEHGRQDEGAGNEQKLQQRQGTEYQQWRLALGPMPSCIEVKPDRHCERELDCQHASPEVCCHNNSAGRAMRRYQLLEAIEGRSEALAALTRMRGALSGCR